MFLPLWVLERAAAAADPAGTRAALPRLKVGAGVRWHRRYLFHFWWIARKTDSAVCVEFQKDVRFTKEHLKGSRRQLRPSGALALCLNSVLWRMTGSWEPRAGGVNVPYGSVPLSLDCTLADLV